MFNYNPKINYTEYRMRMCSCNWEYCDGKCNSCPKRNITYSTSTNTIPGSYSNTTNSIESYSTKNYSYTIDYLHRDSLTIPDNYNNSNRNNFSSILGIDKNLYCQTIGPWSYYREIYKQAGNLI